MNDTIIRVESLGKLYRIGRAQQRHDTLRDVLASVVGRKSSSPTDDSLFWALHDVSFDVKRGEVVGIIGRNGAGKSTLLKILSRITEPTSGRAEINGRVGSLLEVGTGFHPELTGRENIYLNGAILGMKRTEINRRFDEIVAFAEIERFLDTPVKRYSSGMYVRLAFAVAAHLDPEILLVDEVLAVGDAAFQKKCLGRMGDVAREGRSVLFVSHNLAAVENLCSSALLLEEGRTVLRGEVGLVIKTYLSQVTISRTLPARVLEPITISLSVMTENYMPANVVQSGDKVIFVAEISAKDPISKAGLGVGIVDSRGERIVTFHSRYQSSDPWPIRNRCTCVVEWSECFLCPGNYWLVAALYDKNELIASWQNAGSLVVISGDYFGTGKLPEPHHQGHVLARTHWTINTDVNDDELPQ